MESPVYRKPREHFDTASHPSHVTFDDGKNCRRNFPWSHYVQAYWDYGERNAIKVEIGEWKIVIVGKNIIPLLKAIEERSLVCVRAQPELAEDGEQPHDAFATEIRFTEVPAKQRQGELPLGWK